MCNVISTRLTLIQPFQTKNVLFIENCFRIAVRHRRGHQQFLLDTALSSRFTAVVTLQVPLKVTVSTHQQLIPHHWITQCMVLFLRLLTSYTTAIDHGLRCTDYRHFCRNAIRSATSFTISIVGT